MFDKENLAQAAEEMNRYSTARLEVDPSVAGLKVSGMYRVGDNGAFARSLAKLLPIAVRQSGDTLVAYRPIPDPQKGVGKVSPRTSLLQ